jgi:hypothetical protein
MRNQTDSTDVLMDVVHAVHDAVLRFAVAVGIAMLIVFLSLLALVVVGQDSWRSNGATLCALVAASALVGFCFCLRRSLRPAVSSASASVAVGFAWFVSLTARFTTPSSSRFTVEAAFATLGFAILYVLMFRPLGEAVKREDTEERLKAIILDALATSSAASADHADV